jgi:hypothetical protein
MIASITDPFVRHKENNQDLATTLNLGVFFVGNHLKHKTAAILKREFKNNKEWLN